MPDGSAVLMENDEGSSVSPWTILYTITSFMFAHCSCSFVQLMSWIILLVLLVVALVESRCSSLDGLELADVHSGVLIACCTGKRLVTPCLDVPSVWATCHVSFDEGYGVGGLLGCGCNMLIPG